MMIDAHHHLWDPARGDYGWMPVGDAVLSRVYTPDDLAPQLKAADIGATVLVQAAPSVAETGYLLDIAARTPWVAGVVGWVDFEVPADRAALDRLASHPKLKGVRPMIQDIPDPGWMLTPQVQWAYEALIDLGLTFDCLGFPQHLDNFHTLLTRYPPMRAVVDHCMKPRIGEAGSFGAWADGMSRIAEDTRAFCKLSGLVTEAPGHWSAEMLAPYAAHVLEVFGPGRVMWGSDWPVCRLCCDYGAWHAMALALTADLPPADRARIFGGTAAEFYDLKV